MLSKSTQAYDRGDKFGYYQKIPTLHTYILVAQDTMRVEKYTRSGGDTWSYRAYEGPGAALEVESPKLSIPLEAIYRRVRFDAGLK